MFWCQGFLSALSRSAIHFKSHCVIAYGTQLWDFESSNVRQYFTTWRKCVRKLWKLPYRTHSFLLPGICQDISIEHQLLSRSVKFVHSSVSVPNNVLNICGKLAMNGSGSSVCNTIAQIVHQFHFDRNNFIGKNCVLPMEQSPISEVTGAIRDLAIARHLADGDDRIVLDIYWCIFAHHNY